MKMLDGEMAGGGGEGTTAVVSASALEALTRSEIDVQVATARRYPRSIQQVKQLAMSMATLDVVTAVTCFYKIPRDGKLIEGPSIRLAEIFCAAWGNLRYGSRVIGEDDRFVTAQGFCHDLQSNIATAVEVRRRITTKAGKKYGDDMIGVTGAAACSIALRNAIFQVVPRTYINEVYEQAKKVAVGDAKTLVERRDALVTYITTKMGVPLDRVLTVVGRVHENDITLNDMETLYGLSTAVRDGEVTIDAAFPPPAPAGGEAVDDGKGKTDSLAAKLQGSPKPQQASGGSTASEGKAQTPAAAAARPAPADAKGPTGSTGSTGTATVQPSTVASEAPAAAAPTAAVPSPAAPAGDAVAGLFVPPAPTPPPAGDAGLADEAAFLAAWDAASAAHGVDASFGKTSVLASMLRRHKSSLRNAPVEMRRSMLADYQSWDATKVQQVKDKSAENQRKREEKERAAAAPAQPATPDATAAPAAAQPAKLDRMAFERAMAEVAATAGVPESTAGAGVLMWEDAHPVPADFIGHDDFATCLAAAREGAFDWASGTVFTA